MAAEFGKGNYKWDLAATEIGAYDICPFTAGGEPCLSVRCPLRIDDKGHEFCSIAEMGVMSQNLADIKESLEDIAFAIERIANAVEGDE